uniref:TSYL2 protein n=1 Tax=Malurus cyaneus samueli TaxID=2593467 RepID=A0A8C5TUL2_9PASS
MGGLETTREVTGSLGITNERKGSLETAVTRCLEQGRRSKEGPETASKILESMESDASPGGGLKNTSRRKGKTPVRPKGSVETAGIQCLDWEGKGGLETTSEVLVGTETTREDTESLETTIIGHVKWDREQKGGLETTTEPEEGLEPTPTACVGQSRGGPGLPDLVGVPEPAGVPVSKEQVAEESAVISLGEDEDEEEEEERDEGPARYLAALEAVQLELEAVEEEAARAFRRLRTRFCLRRRPHLQRRNRLIQHIPGFWVTAFLNHPQLSAMISDRDEDALSYMTSLQVCSGADPGPHLRPREAVVEVIFHLVVLGQAEQVAVLHVHQVLGLPGSRESARGRPRGSEDHPGTGPSAAQHGGVLSDPLQGTGPTSAPCRTPVPPPRDPVLP